MSALYHEFPRLAICGDCTNLCRAALCCLGIWNNYNLKGSANKYPVPC